MAPAAPMPAAPAKKEDKKVTTYGPTQAVIVVSLPAEAKLSIDDQPTISTSAVRTFATPALAASTEYYYTLKAEVMRDGKAVTSTQRVAVHAGQTSRVTLDIPTASGVVSAK